MSENENISKNGWSEYGRLVLKELERLNQGQTELHRDFGEKFNELDRKMTEFKNTEKEVETLKDWKDNINEIWSVTQMKEAKDELYDQKNSWTKVIGAIIAIQILFTLFMTFKDKLF